MKRLSRTKAAQQAQAMVDAATRGPDTWDPWYSANSAIPARIEIPMGELFNDAIQGFVWAWQKMGKLTIDAIKKGESFDAQGLEGKVVVTTFLPTALRIWQALPPFRCNIYI